MKTVSRAWQVFRCWIRERLRAEAILFPPLSRLLGLTWRDICNSIDDVKVGPDGLSRYVDQRDSSYLTVARIFPRVGGRILKTCIREYSFEMGDGVSLTLDNHEPKFSIVLPFAGQKRLELLQLVLQSLITQDLSDFEIIVIHEREFEAFDLPDDCRLRCFPIDECAGSQFNKGRMFNTGVREAKAPIVVLHDSDIVIPRSYLADVDRVIAAGWEAMCPIRFLFYLTRAQTETALARQRLGAIQTVEDIRQNFAGGSVAISRDAYEGIGGFDEEFLGWGGEDVEFFDRMKSRRFYPGRLLPALHLWHAPAEGKSQSHPNLRLAAEKMAVPTEERIRTLRGEF